MRSSSMTNEARRAPVRRHLVRLGLAGAALLFAQTIACPAQPAAPPRPVRIVYVEREDDPAYDRVPGADGIVRAQRPAPLPGAELGIKDARAVGRAAGVTFQLERRTLEPEEDIKPVIAGLAGEGAAAILLDVPLADMAPAAKAVEAGRVPLFNIRHGDDELRTGLCATDLFHVVPASSALTDALVQYVVRKAWRRVLVLVGPEAEDARLARTFQASAKKFGARIVDVKPFVLGNDPRNREQSNVALMTGDSDFDVVFLADSVGEFGRYVAYRLARPRPVIGSEGLAASAWHQSSERYGAPQLNRRFERDAGRPMTDADWSAWVAVRAIVEAVVRGNVVDGPAIGRALRQPSLAIEMSKGVPGSFRPWDHQLRQPIMLHTYNAVIDFAPVEGFLHEFSRLDTLGADVNDSPCGRAAR